MKAIVAPLAAGALAAGALAAGALAAGALASGAHPSGAVGGSPLAASRPPLPAATVAGFVTAVAAPTPTAAQLNRAVLAAERSPALWATINDCGARGHAGVVGVRGQMPALGFAAQLEMTIRLSYWSATAGRYRAVPHATKQITLGTVTSGTVQDGAAFRFKPPVRLAASVTFTWMRGGQVLGVVTRRTSGGHRGVDDATPPGFSASVCALKA